MANIKAIQFKLLQVGDRALTTTNFPEWGTILEAPETIDDTNPASLYKASIKCKSGGQDWLEMPDAIVLYDEVERVSVNA